MSWMDKLDKSKYSPETLRKWKLDEMRAKKQHRALMKNPLRDLPSTAPAVLSSEAKAKALKNKKK